MRERLPWVHYNIDDPELEHKLNVAISEANPRSKLVVGYYNIDTKCIPLAIIDCHNHLRPI